MLVTRRVAPRYSRRSLELQAKRRFNTRRNRSSGLIGTSEAIPPTARWFSSRRAFGHRCIFRSVTYRSAPLQYADRRELNCQRYVQVEIIFLLTITKTQSRFSERPKFRKFVFYKLRLVFPTGDCGVAAAFTTLGLARRLPEEL
jgi:hypothetical protein